MHLNNNNNKAGCTGLWQTSRITGVLLALVVLITASEILAALPNDPGCDCSDWVLRIAGKVVNVNTDGSFSIPNIQAPDQFGPGGPGTRPDFLSDDFYRVIGTSVRNGLTLYAYTEYFQVAQNRIYTPTNWTLTFTPPPMPESIRAVPDK